MLALSIRQKEAESLPDLVVRSFFAAADINEAEQRLRQAERTPEGGKLVRVADNAAGLKLGPQTLDIQNTWTRMLQSETLISG